MVNQYPRWKNWLLLLFTVAAFVFALPNWYGDAPGVQISRDDGAPIPEEVTSSITNLLTNNNLNYRGAESTDGGLTIRFNSTDDQLRARELVAGELNSQYTVALGLIPQTPKWLLAIGATPMKLGLDLRGGIHFLLEVDIPTIIKNRIQSSQREIMSTLREARLRYTSVNTIDEQQKLAIRFADPDILNKALVLLKKEFNELTFSTPAETPLQITAEISEQSYQELRQYTVEQTMLVLRNRVNELGIGEAVVQQQGANRIAVDLPGVQDAARAKQILGGTATLSFHLVDQIVPANTPTATLPVGTRLMDYSLENAKLILQSRSLLSGGSIVGAMATMGENGRPAVNIRVAGDEISAFHRITGRNIGKRMAIIFMETKTDEKMVDGEMVRTRENIERVISAATIQSALGANFVITNLESLREAQNLALLLRAGALIAPVETIEERIIGPSLGAENIHKGAMSILVGFLLIILSMAIYYRLFGVIANIALIINVLLIVAIMSIFGAVLSLPGIAGIVLTIGMAVDANVLIFERIREELRNGSSPQASIYAGFERAFSTIVDAQITTLIVGIILFAIGTGAVKGFAVTLMIGILTSMITAIMYSRALVNLVYGNRQVKRLSIGI